MLLVYRASSNRLLVLRIDAPLWTRHSHPRPAGGALTSPAFVRKPKLDARKAGRGQVHLHQSRHTYARIVAEETGSLYWRVMPADFTPFFKKPVSSVISTAPSSLKCSTTMP